jgi:preprotein translocase subunit SecF
MSSTASWHDPNNTGGSIFFNKQNVVFTLPLVAICAVYAYFKFIPLHVGLSIIGGAIVIFKIHSSIQTHKIEKQEEKIAKLDDSFLKELAADELMKEEKEKQKAAKKKVKADAKAKQRIAATKKKEKQQNQNQNDDDEDDADYAAFVKGSKKKV